MNPPRHAKYKPRLNGQAQPMASSRARWRRFWRSSGVGVMATAVDLLVLTALVELVGLAPSWANVPALLAGVSIQFTGNKHYAFEDRSRALMRQGAQFALVEVGSIVLNAALFHLMVTFTPLPYLAGRLVISMTVYVSFSYPLWCRVFSPADIHADALGR